MAHGSFIDRPGVIISTSALSDGEETNLFFLLPQFFKYYRCLVQQDNILRADGVCGIWLLYDMGKAYITCIFLLGFNVQGKSLLYIYETWGCL
jgi:hypothetical protein